MRLQVEAVLRSAAFAMLLSVHAAAPALAQTQCDEHAFSVQIDRTAQALRALNRDSQTRFQERLDAIAKARALTDEQKADIAAAAMDDGKLAQFNGEIEELIAELDTLSATPESQVSCARLEDLKRVRDKLLTVMGRKSGFVLAELEAQNAPATPASEPPSVDVVAKGDAVQPLTPPAQARLVPESPSQVRPAPQPPSPASWSVNLTPAPPQPQKAAPQRTAVSKPQSASPSQSPHAGERVASLPPAKADAALPPSSPSGYSVEEIRNAGEGIFGSLTSEFAVVVNYAFKRYGQPNAYIVGDEGGGAFLAGLRYGDGTLFTRVKGVEGAQQKIYWQGPSVGADIGATGSRTLFLVYNLEDPKALYRRFPGLDGSAYIAGGFGLTVYKSGDTLIVPIRTGLGLRIGASIAYLKFTERASLNPF